MLLLLLLLPSIVLLQASIFIMIVNCELRNCFQSHSWFPTRKYYTQHVNMRPFSFLFLSLLLTLFHNSHSITTNHLSPAAQFIYFISFVVWCSLLNVVNETDDWLYVWLWNRIHDVNVYTMERVNAAFSVICCSLCSHSSIYPYIHPSIYPCYAHSSMHSFVRLFVYSFFGWASVSYICLHVCNAIVWWCDLVASDDRRQLINARQQLIVEHMLSLYQRTDHFCLKCHMAATVCSYTHPLVHRNAFMSMTFHSGWFDFIRI